MGWSNRTALLAFVAAVIATPFVFPDFYYKLNTVGIYTLIAIGLCLLLGYAGQISLGHAAFFAIGAYTSGILTTHFEWSPFLAVFPAIAIAVVVAVLVGLPALKLHGHYLAMATLAFGEIVHKILTAWIDVTGGPNGLISVPLWKVGDFKLKYFGTEREAFYIVWGAVIVGLVVALHVVHSRVGRALRSIHDGEEAARSLGVASSGYKVKVFVLSAVYASVAGTLYIHIKGSVTPEVGSVDLSILFIIMVIVGGMRNIWGAVLGAIVMGIIEEWLNDMGMIEDWLIVMGMSKEWLSEPQKWRLVIYGLILGSMMMFIPQGVLPAVRQGLGFLWRKVLKRRVKEAVDA